MAHTNNYLEVSNDNNKVIINDEYKNLAFLEKFKCTNYQEVKNFSTMPSNAYRKWFVAQAFTTGTATIIIPKKEDELIFLSGVAPGRLIQSSYYEDHAKIYIGRGVKGPITRAELSNIEFYICGVPNRRTNCGLEIYNENQDVIFSSGNTYLNVLYSAYTGLTEDECDMFGIHKPATFEKFKKTSKRFEQDILVCPLQNCQYETTYDTGGDGYNTYLYQSYIKLNGNEIIHELAIVESDEGQSYANEFQALTKISSSYLVVEKPKFFKG